MGKPCFMCKKRDARNRFAILCLVCMAIVHVAFQDHIKIHGCIGHQPEENQS